MWRAFVYALLLGGLGLSLLPVYNIWWSSRFAEKHGCVLHEGFVNPCVVDGVDHGTRLANAFVSGWLMLLTLPVALVLGVILIIFIIIDLVGIVRRRKARR